MSQKTKPTSRPPQKVVPPPKLRLLETRRWLLVPLVALPILLLFMAGGGVAYALHQEESDAFCGSCHTEPEATYVTQTQAAAPTTLAAFHAHTRDTATRCIDCHSGGGTFGRMSGLTQGATDLVAFLSGHYRVPAVTTQRLGDDSCLKCHQDILNRGGFNNHFHQFLPRWQQIDSEAAGCVTCHTAHSTNADFQQYLSQQNVSQTCNACHRRAGG
jgi:hypothetical protein